MAKLPKINIDVTAPLVNISLLPKQRQLYDLVRNSNYTWIGFGGSAGGSKSHAVRDVNMSMCLEFPNINTLIFRRLSNDLLENHVLPFFTRYPQLRNDNGMKFNKTDNLLYWSNGSITKFGYADSEDDIIKFQGQEYDLIFVDEATHCSQRMIEFLRTRNRSKILPKAKMIFTMNPGGVGHAYMKRLFIDKAFMNNEDPNDYIFIPSRVHDNVIWVKDALKEDGISIPEYYSWNEEKRLEYTMYHSDYAKALSKLPDDTRRAYLMGDWDVFGGRFFTAFNSKRAVIDPFEIPKEWMLVASIDPGFASPCSFGLTAKDYEGNIYRLYTYYEEERNAHDHAEAIKYLLYSKESILYPMLKGRRPNYFVSGHDAWAKKDRYAVMANDLTFADVFQSKGLYLQRAMIDRKQGWMAWKSLMSNQFLTEEEKTKGIKEQNKYWIFQHFNTPLISEMNAVRFSTKDPEDIEGKGNDVKVTDHALDEQRYGIMALFTPKERKEFVNPFKNIARPFIEQQKGKIDATTF